MNWKGYERKHFLPNLRYCLYSCVEGLRKTTKELDQDSQSRGQLLNLYILPMLNFPVTTSNFAP
jgi:hypothetical protein